MQNYTYAALLYFDEAQNVKKKYLYILHILQIRMAKCYMNYNY